MQKIGVWIIAVATLALAACGGGSSDFAGSSSSSSGGATNGAASITLIASAPQINSDGSTPATITAIVKNSSNAVVAGAAVVFSTATAGATLTPTTTVTGVAAGTTDSNGEAAASLSTLGDPANRTIVVNATVGTVNASINVAVVGSKLVLTGASSLVLNATGTYSAALTDSAGNGIANTALAVSSANGNTLSAASVSTDSTGHVTFTVTAKNSGADTITVSGLGLSASQALSVSSASFNVTVPAANANVPIATSQAVTVVWTNNGAAVTGQTVTFSSTRGTFGGATTATAVTDGTGTASVTISSQTAGPAVITATATGVSAQQTFNFVATNPTQITVQANPASIQTQGSSTITAIVRDPSDNLVAGQTVDFQLTDKTGGSISVATAITDAQGIAQTVYTGTTVPSASNGVIISATVAGTSVQGSVSLTVGGQTVFLSLGTGSVLSENAQQTQFIVPFVIQALDASGNAVVGANVTVAIHSLPPTGAAAVTGPLYQTDSNHAAYRKGYYETVAAATANNDLCTVAGTSWCFVVRALCLNEDVLGTGIFSAAEDLNGNGRLDPADVAAASPSSVVTDSTGSANIVVTYPEDHSNFVQVKLTASATVSGTQSSTSSVFWLPILASYMNNANATPPGALAPPYGVSNNCANPN